MFCHMVYWVLSHSKKECGVKQNEKKYKIRNRDFFFKEGFALPFPVKTHLIHVWRAAPSAANFLHICVQGDALRQSECATRYTPEKRRRLAPEIASYHTANPLISENGHPAFLYVRNTTAPSQYEQKNIPINLFYLSGLCQLLEWSIIKTIQSLIPIHL